MFRSPSRQQNPKFFSKLYGYFFRIDDDLSQTWSDSFCVDCDFPRTNCDFFWVYGEWPTTIFPRPRHDD